MDGERDIVGVAALRYRHFYLGLYRASVIIRLFGAVTYISLG